MLLSRLKYEVSFDLQQYYNKFPVLENNYNWISIHLQILIITLFYSQKKVQSLQIYRYFSTAWKLFYFKSPILSTVIELAGKRYLKLRPAVKVPADGTTFSGFVSEFSSAGAPVKILE